MKKIFVLLLAFNLIAFGSDEVKNKIQNRIAIKFEKELVYIELVLKNDSKNDFETTQFGVNNNSLVIIFNDNKKTKLTLWKDGIKKSVIKKGETKSWQLKFEELKDDLSTFKLEKGEYRLVWDCEGNLSNEIIVLF